MNYTKYLWCVVDKYTKYIQAVSFNRKSARACKAYLNDKNLIIKKINIRFVDCLVEKYGEKV